jgi:outer membrane receptor for ferrienterochelin and colicins
VIIFRWKFFQSSNFKQMKYILTIMATWMLSCSYSQIEGVVYGLVGDKKVEIPDAQVFFKNGRQGKTTCSQGMFLFEYLPKLPDTLIVRALGYHPDTIPIGKNEKQLYLEVLLLPDHVLDEVVIAYKRDNSSILRLDPRNVETLNSGELRKAACCNLSESFETNATVDVNMTDGVSGAKQIAMMGLNGIYTQIQAENVPIIQNLNAAHGLNSIPGPWIESIQITKGTGTVMTGYESMAGLINIEYRKPEDMERFFANGYANIQGRYEINLHGAEKLSNKWSTAWFLHGATVQGENDRNNDGFRDIMMGEDVAFYNRWKYDGEYFKAQFGVKANFSEKTGGQTGFTRGQTPDLYGVFNRNRNVELTGKTGFIFKKRPATSIGVIYYAKYYGLEVDYGPRSLQGIQKRGYINGVYDGFIGSTLHKIKFGPSLVVDDLIQSLDDNLPNGFDRHELIRTEIVPGAFGEYTYSGLRTTIVAGARQDYHNMYGWQFTPRFNLKQVLTEKMDLRATVGRGFRVPNYVVDNIGLLATNLPWIVTPDILPEISWNAGVSWLYQFKVFEEKALFTVDYFHTYFVNQLIVDRDHNPSHIMIENLNGQSFSHVVQVEFRFTPIKNLEIKTAYKYLDVRATMGGELNEQMMIPRHRGFVNLGYTTRNKRWEYDLTASVFGSQRLAVVRLPDGSLSQDNRSETFPMLNAQITHVYKRFDFYLGGENLLDYRLRNPIIDVQNPFGDYFDATRVWAPIFGINIYAGFRYSIK